MLGFSIDTWVLVTRKNRFGMISIRNIIMIYRSMKAEVPLGRYLSISDQIIQHFYHFSKARSPIWQLLRVLVLAYYGKYYDSVFYFNNSLQGIGPAHQHSRGGTSGYWPGAASPSAAHKAAAGHHQPGRHSLRPKSQHGTGEYWSSPPSYYIDMDWDGVH